MQETHFRFRVRRRNCSQALFETTDTPVKEARTLYELLDYKFPGMDGYSIDVIRVSPRESCQSNYNRLMEDKIVQGT